MIMTIGRILQKVKKYCMSPYSYAKEIGVNVGE